MPSWGGAASGAASGAALGSIIPGIGNLGGALIGGIAGGLFSHGAKKAGSGSTTTGTTNPDGTIDAITKTIGGRADANTKRADALATEGDDALGQVTNYFKQLTSGDPAAIQQATMPQRARVIDQYDTARDAIAKFGGRSGGATSASAMSRISEADKISDITAGAQSEGADKLAQIGLGTDQLALSHEQLASTDLNSIIAAMLNKESLDVTKSGQKSQSAAGLAQGIGQLLGLFLTRGKSGGSGFGTGGRTPSVSEIF